MKYLICIEISTWYESHGATKVRCENNSIFASPIFGRVRTLVLKTMHIYRRRNFCTLLKGEVQTSLRFSQAAQRRGANLPHPIVHYSEKFLVIFAGCTLVECELPPGVRRLDTCRVKTSLRLLSGGVRTSQGKRNCNS
jgi:hypothetical protein